MKGIFQIAALVFALGAGIVTAHAMGVAGSTGDLMTQSYLRR